MKRLFPLLALFLLASCGGRLGKITTDFWDGDTTNLSSTDTDVAPAEEPQAQAGDGVHFNPKERTSSYSSTERAEAIRRKQAELGDMRVETLVAPHTIRMSVLPPAVAGDIDQAVSEKAAIKLLQMASHSGISCANGSSPIAIAASFEARDRALTGSAPQKAIVKYGVTYQVLNIHTGDVYGTLTTEISGVGQTFNNAAHNAVAQMQNTSQLQQMIADSEKRILDWYDQNPGVIKAKINTAMGQENFALALALIESVPEQAQKCYAQVHQMEGGVFTKMQQQLAAQELVALKDAIAAANGEYSPDVAAHLALLPTGSKEASAGQKAYDQYIKQIGDERMAKISADERTRMEQLEVQKLKMQYEYAGTEQAASQSAGASKDTGGFFSKAKPFLAGVGTAAVLSAVLRRCWFIF